MFFRRCVETTAMTSGYYILYIYIKYHMTYMTWLETLIFIFRAMFFFFFSDGSAIAARSCVPPWKPPAVGSSPS